MSHINLFAKSSISFIQVFDFSDRNLISEILVRFEKMIRIYQIDCYFFKKKKHYTILPHHHHFLNLSFRFNIF